MIVSSIYESASTPLLHWTGLIRMRSNFLEVQQLLQLATYQLSLCSGEHRGDMDKFHGAVSSYDYRECIVVISLHITNHSEGAIPLRVTSPWRGSTHITDCPIQVSSFPTELIQRRSSGRSSKLELGNHPRRHRPTLASNASDPREKASPPTHSSTVRLISCIYKEARGLE